MDQEWRREGGGKGGGQRVKMGERAALILGSEVHQDGFHQQEREAVAVKLSEDCHHLLTTNFTARRDKNTIRSTLLHSYRNPEPDPKEAEKKLLTGRNLERDQAQTRGNLLLKSYIYIYLNSDMNPGDSKTCLKCVNVF